MTPILLITALLGVSFSLLFRWQGLSMSLGCQEAKYMFPSSAVDAEQILNAWKGKPVVVGWLRVTNVTWSGNDLEVAGQPAKEDRRSDKNQRQHDVFASTQCFAVGSKNSCDYLFSIMLSILGTRDMRESHLLRLALKYCSTTGQNSRECMPFKMWFEWKTAICVSDPATAEDCSGWHSGTTMHSIKAVAGAKLTGICGSSAFGTSRILDMDIFHDGGGEGRLTWTRSVRSKFSLRYAPGSD
jgi:hypothetical protein